MTNVVLIFRWVRFVVIVSVCAGLLGWNAGFAAQLVADPEVKVEVLRAAFPKAVVSVSTQNPLDWEASAWPGRKTTDAFEGEKEYSVVGAADKIEETYATDLLTLKVSKDRRLRFLVYDVTPPNSEQQRFVALAHYTFLGIDAYPQCCQFFGRLFVLTRQPGGWTVTHTNNSLPYRAQGIPTFQLVDLDGDGVDEILVEADRFLAGDTGIWMHIFTTRGGQLVKLAELETARTDSIQNDFNREIDIEKTRQTAGKEIHFKTVYYGSARGGSNTIRMTADYVVKPMPRLPD